DDVEHALVRAGLVLVARVLVDVRRGQHGVALDLGRQRDRAAHLRAGPLGRLDDLAGRAVDQAMIEGLQPNPDLLVRHGEFLSPKSEGPAAGCAGPREMLVLPTTCKNKGRPVARPARGMLHTRKRPRRRCPELSFGADGALPRGISLPGENEDHPGLISLVRGLPWGAGPRGVEHSSGFDGACAS